MYDLIIYAATGDTWEAHMVVMNVEIVYKGISSSVQIVGCRPVTGAGGTLV